MKMTPERIFSKKIIAKNANFSITKSFRCSIEMWQALEALAIKEGVSPNNYMVLVLDLFLQAKVKSRELIAPKRKERQTMF